MKTKILDFDQILDEAEKELEELERIETDNRTAADKSRIVDIRINIQAASSVIDEFGPGAKITIRKIGFGRMQSITDQATKIKVVGNRHTADASLGLAKILTLLAGIVDAPFDITRQYIDDEMDPLLGEFLFRQIDTLCRLTAKKKTDWKPSGEEHEPTQTSS
jgi:hypothetical protein